MISPFLLTLHFVAICVRLGSAAWRMDLLVELKWPSCVPFDACSLKEDQIQTLATQFLGQSQPLFSKVDPQVYSPSK